MNHLAVQALGKLKLHYDGRVSTFPTRYVEELLSYLLLHSQKEHTREHLVDILWPQVTLKKARANLSTTLWRLRKVFSALGLEPTSFLHANRDWVVYMPAKTAHFDVDQFEQRITQAKFTTNEQERAELYAKAIQLYKGDLLEGNYAKWCLIEREMLSRKYLYALGQLMAFNIQQQDYDQATELGLRILQKDYLREEAHRALMFCYWRMGHRELAVRQFHAYAIQLEKELNIPPLAGTISLFNQITRS